MGDKETKKKVDSTYDRLANPSTFSGQYRARFTEKKLLPEEQLRPEEKKEKKKLDPEEKKKVDSTYDRLANPASFHGMYKERFKEKQLIDDPNEQKKEKKKLNAEEKKKVQSTYSRLADPKSFSGAQKARFAERDAKSSNEK